MSEQPTLPLITGSYPKSVEDAIAAGKVLAAIDEMVRYRAEVPDELLRAAEVELLLTHNQAVHLSRYGDAIRATVDFSKA